MGSAATVRTRLRSDTMPSDAERLDAIQRFLLRTDITPYLAARRNGGIRAFDVTNGGLKVCGQGDSVAAFADDLIEREDQNGHS